MTTSGSGYDPDITPQDATVQIPMVSKATGIAPSAAPRPHHEGDPQRTAGIPRQQLHRCPAAQRGPCQVAKEHLVGVRRARLRGRGRPIALHHQDSAVARERVVITGVIYSSSDHRRSGGPPYECQIDDGTGRARACCSSAGASVAGLEHRHPLHGRGNRWEWTAGRLVVWNPIYRIEPPIAEARTSRGGASERERARPAQPSRWGPTRG